AVRSFPRSVEQPREYVRQPVRLCLQLTLFTANAHLRCGQTFKRTTTMAINATFSPSTGLLSELGDDVDNTIVTSRDAAGQIFVNGGAVPIQGGTATVANTAQIQVFGQG